MAQRSPKGPTLSRGPPRAGCNARHFRILSRVVAGPSQAENAAQPPLAAFSKDRDVLWRPTDELLVHRKPVRCHAARWRVIIAAWRTAACGMRTCFFVFPSMLCRAAMQRHQMRALCGATRRWPRQTRRTRCSRSSAIRAAGVSARTTMASICSVCVRAAASTFGSHRNVAGFCGRGGFEGVPDQNAARQCVWWRAQRLRH